MKLRSFAHVIAAFAPVLSPAAHADAVFAVTPGGRGEAIFDKPVDDTLSTLSNLCMNKGWSITTSTTSQLTCEIQLSMGQSIMGQLLMGNSYSTPPRQFVQFSIGEIGASSRVQVSQWVELQMAFGQVRRNEINTPAAINSEISFLLEAGARLPPGTRFPNHVVVGVDGTDTPHEGKQGYRVNKIAENSSAHRAGVQEGDVIYEIAGKRWKDFNGYLDATEKAAKATSYPIKLERAGQRHTLTLTSDFRPSIVAPAVAAAEEVTSPPVTLTPVGNIGSIADEIAKLAALRTQGILTESEFQAQKARLLTSN